MNRISQYWPKTAVNITQALAHTHTQIQIHTSFVAYREIIEI